MNDRQRPEGQGRHMTMDGISKARKLVGLLGMLLVLSLASGGVAAAAPATDATPSITSDKADYAPGELVVLSGAHWQPGETVHINVNDDHSSSWSRDVDVTAAADGTISDSFNLPDWFVAQYTVTATSASGSQATWTFTDGNLTVGVTPTPYRATIGYVISAQANCPSTATGSSAPAGNGTTFNVGVGNSESARLNAPATATASDGTSRAFVNWTADTGVTFTPISGTNGRSVCVAGFNGSRNISANYAATSATTPTVTAA